MFQKKDVSLFINKDLIQSDQYCATLLLQGLPFQIYTYNQKGDIVIHAINLFFFNKKKTS